MTNRPAILVIDMLNDFINGKLRLEGGKNCTKYSKIT